MAHVKMLKGSQIVEYRVHSETLKLNKFHWLNVGFESIWNVYENKQSLVKTRSLIWAVSFIPAGSSFGLI